ncbi:adenylyltransferase/cytidyltransferase family protein [Candidatus Woesearchaeota archaeon]|nr:adenylyltransferase/cytidyltransferase family protein [Candidatus Woesearchaeota archaeon]
MKKILIFGSFDRIHKGHLNLFKQARKQGDMLIAVIARDSTIKKVKGKTPKYSENIRQRHVALYVDNAILGNKTDKYAIIKKIKPDIICLGYDQNSFTEDLKKHFKKKIIRLKSYKPHIYKSSKIK